MKRHTLTLLACAAALAAVAVPAKRKPFVFRQPDGTEIVVTLVGDEHEHFYIAADGQRLAPVERDGAWWLMPDNEHSADTESAAAHDGSAHNDSRRAPQRITPLGHYPTLGSPRQLVLLVDYPDCPFTHDAEAFRRMLCEEGYSADGATGSARDYFSDQSRRLFTPDIEVVGPITLPHPRAYYGSPTANMYDAQPWLMLTDAAPLVDDEVDFARFDNDADGFVDNVFIFYAGKGQNDGGPLEAVWPHAANIWTYYALDCTLDGVRLGSYACTNELTAAGRLTGIGTFCHEYSHVLGLPDLYSTLHAADCFSPGAFELMDSGSYNNEGRTPPNMSAYDRAALGWTMPEELAAPETVALQPDGQARTVATVKDTEYYILENRQQQGWDAYIPAHGMLIWHIDYDARAWADNQVNVIAAHQRVDLVEADGVPTDDTRDADAFPGARQTTAANLMPWTGIPLDAPITDIAETPQGTVTFKFRGGGERIEAPTALSAEATGPCSFRAEWTGVPAVTDYDVVVWRGDEAMPVAATAEQPHTTADGRWTTTVAGLEPLTRYRCAVVAVDGQQRSPLSDAVWVSTLDPTFDMLAPTDLTAQPTATGWTLDWTALPGAVAYEAEVYAHRIVAPEVQTLDFTGGLAALPKGWTTTSTQTSGMAGTYGSARPSLLLQPGEWLQSPAFSAPIVDYSYWSQGPVEATLPTPPHTLRLANTGEAPAYVDDVVISYGGETQHEGSVIYSTADKTAQSTTDPTEPTIMIPAAPAAPPTISGTLYARVRGVSAEGQRSTWSTEIPLPTPEGLPTITIAPTKPTHPYIIPPFIRITPDGRKETR